MNPTSQTCLTLIQGGTTALEQSFRSLVDAPQNLSQDEFERLIELHHDRLGMAGILGLAAKRIHHRKYADKLEQNALLAIIEGESEAAHRLLDVIGRRNALGLQVISSS